jgi:hypothetical protein
MKKTKSINMRLSEAEFFKITEMAKVNNISKTEVILSHLLDKEIMSSVDIEMNSQVLYNMIQLLIKHNGTDKEIKDIFNSAVNENHTRGEMFDHIKVLNELVIKLINK